MAASEITPAAVRLYARSVEIEIEVEDMIADGDHMTTEELLASRLFQRGRFLQLVAERLANITIGDGSVHRAAIEARKQVLSFIGR